MCGVSEYAVVLACTEMRRKNSTWFPNRGEIIEIIKRYDRKMAGLAAAPGGPAIAGEAATVSARREREQAMMGTTVWFAFQGALVREIRHWLRRAESVDRITKMTSGIRAYTPSAELISRLRYIIDTANVAMLRRSRSQDAWTLFCSAADGTEQTASKT
jgi:hypothetical protein